VSSDNGSNIPSWVFDIDDPKKFVLTTVLGFLVGGIASFVRTTTTGVYYALTQVNEALQQAGNGVEESFRSVGDALLEVEGAFFTVFRDVGANAGIAAPVAQAILLVLVFGFIIVTVGIVLRLLLALSPIP